jgi:thiamine biosynthesis lipoprotein
MPAPSQRRSAVATWEALGTSVVLKVTSFPALAEARAIVTAELARIDHACSRFRTDSELARVNGAKGRAVEVSPLFIQALQVALRAAELTDGDVDPALGEALVLAGYDRDWRLLEPAGADDPPPPLRLSAQRRVGWRAVELDAQRGTVRVPAPIQLDLGATAKAWAADRCARAAARATGAGVLVSLGGDIATAGAPPSSGWRVHVTDDHRSEVSAPGQTVSIVSGGLATSSIAVRRWRHVGHAMHHVIDPRTHAPVQGPWQTVSVAAADCTDANIASTAALVRAQDAPEWLAAMGLPARLVDASGGVCAVGGWPSEATGLREVA